MRKNTFFFTAFLLLFFSPLFSQSHKCGVTPAMGEMIRQQIIQNRHEMRDYVSVRSGNIYLPVRFFLVAENDGSGRASELTALRSLCLLNENYADQEIQFFLKEFIDVNNSTLYDNPGNAFNIISNQMNNKYDAINVFVVKQIGDSNNGTVLAYYQPPASGPNRNDWLVCAETYLDNFEVMTHEIGHYFSLNHTFFGWETAAWENGIPAAANNFIGGQNVPTERADGSNCATAADMICDTPADYLHNFDQGCSYKDNALDPGGSPINPDPNNYMTYNNNSCNPDLYFTTEQKAEISNSLNSFSRNYLPKNIVPDLSEVTGKPTLIYPLTQDPPMPFNSVKMEWTAIPNATHYFLDIKKPGAQPLRYVVAGQTNFTVTELEPNSNYFWSVTAFSNYSTCAPTSNQTLFKTGTDLLNDTNFIIAGLNDWQIQPNPVRNGQAINLLLKSDHPLTADVSLLTITGQNILSYKDLNFASGETYFELETADVPAGIYLVTVRTSSGIQTKKVSIL